LVFFLVDDLRREVIARLAVSEEKIFFKSVNQKQELPMAAMFVNGSGQNEQSLERTFQEMDVFIQTNIYMYRQY
jgi:hypothetical protein